MKQLLSAKKELTAKLKELEILKAQVQQLEEAKAQYEDLKILNDLK